MQAWHLDNQSWCVAFHYVPCKEYPQFTGILPTKKGGGGMGVIHEIYKIFPSHTSQISLQCTLNVEIRKLVYYS